MLIGCGCNCQEDSDSYPVSAWPGESWSGSFPSQSSWPQSIPPSEPYQPTPCEACVAGVRANAYKVTLGKPPMQQKPPTIFGDYGCVEMLQTPFKVVSGETQGPFGITIINPIDNRPWSCLYGVNNYDPGPPPALGDPIDCSRIQPGHFAARDTPNRRPCATEPACEVRFATISDTYQVRLYLRFYSSGYCSPTFSEPGQHQLLVEYRSATFLQKISCLNRINLSWYTASGNRERRNPDDPNGLPESYGMGPGNNFSYQFHRGDFPQTIFIEPWRTV